MRFTKSFTELWIFLWILVLHRIVETSCASLRNYFTKPVNFSIIQRVSNVPKNLSDLIEFTPLNLPVESENSTITYHETKDQTAPKIITFKLKAHVIVQNHDINNQSNGESGAMFQNVSDSSLSDIEYLDSDEDFEFWKWKSNSRSRRMNKLEELTTNRHNKTGIKNSTEKDSSKDAEGLRKAVDSNEEINNQIRRSGRQFIFHPYLPYGKDISPDEKIFFGDILPVKMVKFVKSMVEDAPWEQMFMKMVRMIVDQFVDKIIEKMFADKDHHLKKRSLEVLPTLQTHLVRLKRSVEAKPPPEYDYDDIYAFLPPKRMVQDIDDEDKKDESEKKSWLDRFLDFAFPNSKIDESLSDDEFFDRLKKRDTSNTHLLKMLVTLFLNTFEKSSGFISDAKDVLRYKMLKEFLPYLYQKRYVNNNSSDSSNSLDGMKMSHRKFSDNILKRNDILEDFSVTRRKRSTRGNFRKDDEDRLWQAHSRRHKPPNHRSHDECSLRKACNAGRLLSRFPSVEDITLQLRSNGTEPHWDALIWGMKKKRCSRIFCKRQRSPKGSKYSWNDEKSRFLKRDEIVTDLPYLEFDRSNNLTY